MESREGFLEFQKRSRTEGMRRGRQGNLDARLNRGQGKKVRRKRDKILMKIASWNVRGMGSEAKKDEVASMFSKFLLDFCCLQETKLGSFSDHDGKRIWRDGTFRWSAEGAAGRSSGLLTCWNERSFACSSAWSLGGVVIVNGRWRATMDDICIINVYAPCNHAEKRLLWDKLGMVVHQAR